MWVPWVLLQPVFEMMPVIELMVQVLKYMFSQIFTRFCFSHYLLEVVQIIPVNILSHYAVLYLACLLKG